MNFIGKKCEIGRQCSLCVIIYLWRGVLTLSRVIIDTQQSFKTHFKLHEYDEISSLKKRSPMDNIVLTGRYSTELLRDNYKRILPLPSSPTTMLSLFLIFYSNALFFLLYVLPSTISLLSLSTQFSLFFPLISFSAIPTPFIF